LKKPKVELDVIPVETINEFVRYANEERLAKLARGKLRDRLLKRFAKGAVCATDGPFLLEVVSYDRQIIDWSAQVKILLKQIHGKKWAVELTKIIAAAPKLPVHRLDPKLNPAYRDHLVER